jgi:chromosome segregation protein
MRLTKLKIAGFKSFVDPTTVSFPSSLTGVVGPNGCGKSNIIDAVRWVMGEISAKHLRGESMADVIFNGSSARKPLGAASVELVFDNSDAKIGGEYATYNEVSLRRSVSRDGSSDYFINGTKVRRKDITQLFLGTGLGTRSYAIIEQGMISRVIEARTDDMRAFLEEAAGISRYKERRRETESRISHTRENLDRLNDLREEVEKQIRHLQRQAATARRYQSLKEEERKLLAEVLALRLQSLDLEAQARDAAMESCDTALHAQVADLREVEAHIERVRVDQAAKVEALNAIQARFYEAGAEVARTEQSIQHAREMRQRQQADLEQVQAQLADLNSVMERDRSQLDALAQELAVMAPELDGAHERESAAARALAACEHVLTEWQVTWDAHAKSVASGQRETQVERARIEQLDSQQRRLLQQQERLTTERTALAELQPSMATEALAERMAQAQDAGTRASNELQELLAELSRAREAEREQTQALNALRARHQEAQGKLVSTEALQQAALGKASGKVAEWLKSKSLHLQPRVAQQLRVEKGWERAVETVLGSYLEAVCVDGLESVTSLLPSFQSGHLAVVSTLESGPAQADAAGASADSLLAKIQGNTVLASVLAPVRTAESLQEAMNIQPRLRGGESVVTRDGIWLGAEWLRVSRDADAHAGVIEREEVLREVRTQVANLAEELRQLERRQEATRERVRDHEDRRDRLQAEVNRLHREHVDRKAEHDAAQSRRADAERRLAQLETELGDVASDLASSEADLHACRGRMETAIDALAALEPQRVELEQSRERMRSELAAARTAASTAQQQARELALQVQSRRSSHSALTTTLSRIEQQLEGLKSRQQEVADQLAQGETPLVAAQAQLEQFLQQRANVEAELQAARIASDELESQLRERDSLRSDAEARVEAARGALDEARLATQQVRVRRESVAEQLAATSFEFDALRAQLPEGAAVESWEAQLEDTRSKIERLGQVNLAAIGEYKEQSERKEYLDRQCKDLTDALDTLESAMRKIDRETRARFQETFDRVNAGLKEKFPRLFGGGHAYLELTGEESSVAGVSVMARPPGKRNSTISQLSGGEKALTAVALVFSIFDLNPAPFCLLDEVDAPLDENNVGRFCDIVREMSRNVQFIFITHNKTTMELASQLVGVTMNEPGVSRLVAVDVDEAVRMAAM